MKKLNNYKRAVQYVTKIYGLINSEYFNNELEAVTVTIQESSRSYGHISTSSVWFTDDGKSTKELNISANYLRRPIEDIVVTLIHEASHVYNLQHGIKDCSRGNSYHNTRFKKTAEELGKIKISRDPKYGWTISEATEETIDFCIRNGLEDIRIGRQLDFSFSNGFTGGVSGNGSDAPVRPKKPSSTRKYICPCCGNSFRATKDLNVMCMDCGEQFVKVN